MIKTPELRLNPDLETIDWKNVDLLFEKVNWSERSVPDMKYAFGRSSFKVFLYNETGEIIAFGRTIDDGRFYAQLADIVVDPAYQGHGLGKLVVETLTDQLKDFNFITLTSASYSADKFYRRLGWEKQSSAFIFPLSEKQYRKHTEPYLEEIVPESLLQELPIVV
jgi:GNAT superfamily N-acetyltransferase